MHERTYFAVGNTTARSLRGAATQPYRTNRLLLVQRLRHRISDWAVSAREDFWEGWIMLGLVSGWKICSESICCCSLRKQWWWKEKLFLGLLVLTTVPSDVGHLVVPMMPGEQSPFISNKVRTPLQCGICALHGTAICPGCHIWSRKHFLRKQRCCHRRNVRTGWAWCFSQTTGGALKWCFALSVQ